MMRPWPYGPSLSLSFESLTLCLPCFLLPSSQGDPCHLHCFQPPFTWAQPLYLVAQSHPAVPGPESAAFDFV